MPPRTKLKGLTMIRYLALGMMAAGAMPFAAKAVALVISRPYLWPL